MKSHHQYMIAAAVGIAAGFYLANAKTATGIYANALIGQTSANIYMAGAKAGTSANTATTAPATNG
jgi:hypothetical protein